MIRARLSDLVENKSLTGHVFEDFLPGAYLSSGGLAFAERGGRSHSYDGPGKTDYHVHTDREAFIILQGTGTMEINGEHHPVGKGDIVVVEPGEDHHLCSSVDDPIVTIWCHAGPNRNQKQT